MERNIMFKSRLYKQYYPITSEQEKINLLNAEYCNILNLQYKYSVYVRAALMQRQQKYLTRMKPITGLCGNLKYGNILHNESVYHQMKTDRKIMEISDSYEKASEMKSAFLYGDEITVHDLNELLRFENYQKRCDIKNILILAVFIIGLFILF